MYTDRVRRRSGKRIKFSSPLPIDVYDRNVVVSANATNEWDSLWGAMTPITSGASYAWLSKKNGGVFPLEYSLNLKENMYISGLIYKCWDGFITGRILGYKVLDHNRVVLAEGTWSNDESIKTVAFNPTNTNKITLVATSTMGGTIDVTYNNNTMANIMDIGLMRSYML